MATRAERRPAADRARCTRKSGDRSPDHDRRADGRTGRAKREQRSGARNPARGLDIRSALAAAIGAPVFAHGVVVASIAAIGPRHRVMAAADSIIPLVVAEAAGLSSVLSETPTGVDGQRPA